MSERVVGRGELVVIMLGGITLGLLTLLPAGQVRVGSVVRTVDFGDLFGFRLFLFTVCAILLVSAGVELLALRHPTARIAASGFGLIGLVTVLWIVTVEGVSLLIPRSLLPPTIRRFTLGLGAAPGPWLAAVVSLITVLACLGLLRPLANRLGRASGESREQSAARAMMVVVTAIGVVMVGFGRTMPLASVRWSGGAIDVEPWAISYLGPGSLVVLVLMVLSGLAVAGRWHVGPLAAVGAGLAWISATVAGLLFATTGVLAETGIVNWAAERVGQDGFAETVVLNRGGSSLMVFAGALAAGVGFAGQMATTETFDE